LTWHWHGRQKERQNTTTPVAATATTLDGLSSGTVNERRPRPVDLSRHYNAALTNAWHFPGGRGSATLRSLPQGVQELGGVSFDVRGIVQLASIRTAGFPEYPVQTTNIHVGTRCRALHFLH